MHLIIDNAPHPMAITEGADHRVEHANDRFCAWVGVEPGAAVGRQFADLFPDHADRGLLSLLDRSFGAAVAAKESAPATSGLAGAWQYSVWPLTRSGGPPMGLVVEIQDRTEEAESRHRLEEMSEQVREVNQRLLAAALQEQEWAEKAEVSNRAKSDFLAMMSHELRTPLSGIVGYADILDAEIGGPLSAIQHDSVNRMKVCTAHLMDLIEDVLLFAQLEAGAVQVRPERVDLCELARESAAVVEPTATNKGLKVRVSTPDHPLTAETDPRKVRQILVNLLGNAVKFTEEGEIRIDVREEPGGICCRVEDTGIGIDASDLERVFDPFAQCEQVTVRRFGGAGLGLAISRSLARMLGGDIRLKSALSVGSTFLVSIPPRLPGSTSSAGVARRRAGSRPAKPAS
jgi:signal transduction histidine kinase